MMTPRVYLTRSVQRALLSPRRPFSLLPRGNRKNEDVANARSAPFNLLPLSRYTANFVHYKSTGTVSLP